MSYNELQIHIEYIGQKLVRCPETCPDILLSQEAGVLPRCLVLETGQSLEATGAVIVGVNPGSSSESERSFYIHNGLTYDSVVDFWKTNTERIPYYTKLRRLVAALGITGPRLWTELVKCESNPELKGELSIQTQRICASKYLFRELEEVPKDWAVLAVGALPFRALSYLLPTRPVIGVPHPRGSFGHFDHLFADGCLKGEFAAQVKVALQKQQAVWLRIENK